MESRDAKRKAVKEIMRKAKRSRYGGGDEADDRSRGMPGLTISIMGPSDAPGVPDADADEHDTDEERKRRRRRGR